MRRVSSTQHKRIKTHLRAGVVLAVYVILLFVSFRNDAIPLCFCGNFLCCRCSPPNARYDSIWCVLFFVFLFVSFFPLILLFIYSVWANPSFANTPNSWYLIVSIKDHRSNSKSASHSYWINLRLVAFLRPSSHVLWINRNCICSFTFAFFFHLPSKSIRKTLHQVQLAILFYFSFVLLLFLGFSYRLVLIENIFYTFDLWACENFVMQVVVVNSCYRLRVFSGMNGKFTNRTKCDLWKFRRRKIQYQNEKCLQTVTDQFNMKQYDEK